MPTAAACTIGGTPPTGQPPNPPSTGLSSGKRRYPDLVRRVTHRSAARGRMGRRQTACKPGSVPPSGSSRAGGDGHSSGTPVAGRLVRPTRAAARRHARRPGSLRRACRSYLVLLPVGFSLPPPSPAARCALTAPFHPCRPPGEPGTSGGVLSVALSLGSPPPGVTRHRASVEPGLSSPRLRGERPSSRLAGIGLSAFTRSVKGREADLSKAGRPICQRPGGRRRHGVVEMPVDAANRVLTLPPNSGLTSWVALPAVASTAVAHAM